MSGEHFFKGDLVRIKAGFRDAGEEFTITSIEVGDWQGADYSHYAMGDAVAGGVWLNRLELVAPGSRRSAEARVAEFVRQWKISYSAEDKVSEVHFDPSDDEGAALLISDLEELLK